MRRDFIAGNWKMHKTQSEAVALAEALVSAVSSESKRIMVAPPFTALSSVASVLRDTSIILGAQNMGSAEQGAHTGEVSVLMLKDLGVGCVILGHSERRHVYGEKDPLINTKIRLALAHDLEVILCVGETLDERERGIAKRVVEEQLKGGLESVTAKQLAAVTIAYEPVWAIGTGKTATPRDADEIHSAIRDLVGQLYDAERGQAMVIQYGGSVKPTNIAELMSMPNIDGVLVGGASLEVETFVPIVSYDR